MILLIDNYDSFVYNLARYVTELGFVCKVVRNDAISLQEISELNPSHIILSPGPCTPNEAGITLDVIRCFTNKIPILGICLGHQAIGQAFGGLIVQAKQPMHGKSSLIYHDGSDAFQGIKNPFQAARYHSLVISEHGFPSELKITARTKEGIIMAVEHASVRVMGFQFHPESILTTEGHKLLLNFIKKSQGNYKLL